jgi:hypothetical protein
MKGVGATAPPKPRRPSTRAKPPRRRRTPMGGRPHGALGCPPACDPPLVSNRRRHAATQRHRWQQNMDVSTDQA